jgi:non-ribosomal peptide synthetase component F
VAVTDDQVAALRAYLRARTDSEASDAERRFLTLSRTGRLDEVGALVYGAFAAAARRRFSPAWTSADVVRFVAEFRGSSAEAAELLSPSPAENQLRGVLGEKQYVLPSEEARARAQFLLLAALTVTLDPQELGQVLAEGRGLADSLIMEL